MSAKVFHWDYTQQPPMADIIEAVHELSGFTVSLTMPDTGSDEYELTVSGGPFADSALDALDAQTLHDSPGADL